jgi:hypothetical protein
MRTVLRLIARLAEDTDGALATIKHRPRTPGSPSWRARYVTGIVGMTPGRPARLLDLVEGHCARSTLTTTDCDSSLHTAPQLAIMAAHRSEGPDPGSWRRVRKLLDLSRTRRYRNYLVSNQVRVVELHSGKSQPAKDAPTRSD